MLTALVMLILLSFSKMPIDITLDSQMIIFAICVSSDLNILSRMIEK